MPAAPRSPVSFQIPRRKEVPNGFPVLLNAIKQPRSLEILTVRMLCLESVACGSGRSAVGMRADHYAVGGRIGIKYDEGGIALGLQISLHTFRIGLNAKAAANYTVVLQAALALRPMRKV